MNFNRDMISGVLVAAAAALTLLGSSSATAQFPFDGTSWVEGAELLVSESASAEQVLAEDVLVIDFEDFPPGPFESHTSQGVTFSAAGGGGAIITLSGPNGTLGVVDANSPRKERRVPRYTSLRPSHFLAAAGIRSSAL